MSLTVSHTHLAVWKLTTCILVSEHMFDCRFCALRSHYIYCIFIQFVHFLRQTCFFVFLRKFLSKFLFRWIGFWQWLVPGAYESGLHTILATQYQRPCIRALLGRHPRDTNRLGALDRWVRYDSGQIRQITYSQTKQETATKVGIWARREEDETAQTSRRIRGKLAIFEARCGQL